MKSLYNKVFKNNQVIYGRPFQVKTLLNLQHIVNSDTDIEFTDDGEDSYELQPDPEELLERAKQECELILKEASFKADRLIEKAVNEAEKKVGEIMEDAWQKGYSKGMAAACEQSEAILAEAEQIRQSASEEHESILAGLEAEIMELVLKIARKAVAGELATNKNVILQLVEDALPNCSNKKGALLKVSPEDSDYLNENREKLCMAAEGADGLEIKRDSALKPGDCIIDTALGSVDAGVDTRLAKIEEAFKEQFEGK